MRRPFLLGAVMLASASTAACDETPTSVVFDVRSADGARRPDYVLMRAYVGTGLLYNVKRFDVKATGAGPDLGTVVLENESAERDVRVQIVGMALPEEAVSEGAAEVTMVEGEQLRRTVVMSPGRLPDEDGDSVPDVIDNCKKVPNTTQQSCTAGGGDAGVDGRAATDVAVSAALDAGGTGSDAADVKAGGAADVRAGG